jgi:hypothetical protein
MGTVRNTGCPSGKETCSDGSLGILGMTGLLLTGTYQKSVCLFIRQNPRIQRSFIENQILFFTEVNPIILLTIFPKTRENSAIQLSRPFSYGILVCNSGPLPVDL